MLFWARNFIFFASHVFPANGFVFKIFEINTAKHNIVIVQHFPFTIQMVQFLVGFNFRTADCMGVIFWDVTPCALLVRPNKGLLYTVLSLTHSLTHSNTLSLCLSLSLLCSFGPYRVTVFSIEVLRSHSDTTFCRMHLDE